MQSKSKLVYAAVLALVVGHDIKTRIKMQILANLAEVNEKNYIAKIEYLCSKLDENGIEADEFDFAVMKYYAD